MKKHLIVIIITLIGIPFIGNAQTKSKWPGVEYAYATGYLYNLEGRLAGNHAIIKRDTTLDETVVGKGVVLNEKQIKTVLDIVNGKNSKALQDGLSSCFIPHHGIVFYDEKDQPVAYITICFYCEGIRIHPTSYYSTRESAKVSPRQEKMVKHNLEQLTHIIKDLGHPVLNSPYEYQRLRHKYRSNE